VLISNHKLIVVFYDCKIHKKYLILSKTNELDKKLFLTCVDKFSKFVIVQPTASRAIEDLKPALLELMNFFPIFFFHRPNAP